MKEYIVQAYSQETIDSFDAHNAPELVRCKDCKHRHTYPETYGAEIDGKWCYWCELHRSWESDDWFCADGERKESW